MIPVDEFMRFGETGKRGRFGDAEDAPAKRWLATHDKTGEYRRVLAEIEDNIKPTGEGQG